MADPNKSSEASLSFEMTPALMVSATGGRRQSLSKYATRGAGDAENGDTAFGVRLGKVPANRLVVFAK
jgi:hypothetical protein